MQGNDTMIRKTVTTPRTIAARPAICSRDGHTPWILNREREVTMATVSVRYIVDKVDEAISFYCEHLGFEEQMHPAPTFAMLSRGDLRLVLSAPSFEGGGGQQMPDGTRPEPGGWNRFMVEVEDLDSAATALRKAGAHFRSAIIEGVGGRQVIIDDPSGNPVELFSPTREEARLEQS
jgi:predicted enzyme related to lactoylglutathione lyase